MYINNTFVLVEPVRQRGEEAGVTMVAKQFKVDTLVTTSSNGITQIASASRYQEIKAEMSEQMEARLAMANSRIEQLASALENVRNNQAQMSASTQSELQQVKDEQAFARQKLAEVETSVAASGQTVIQTMQQTMQQMMQSMQQNLETSMKTMLAETIDDPKRARTS